MLDFNEYFRMLLIVFALIDLLDEHIFRQVKANTVTY